MDYFKAYVDLNFPEAIIGAGAPMPPPFAGKAAAPKKELPKQAFTTHKIGVGSTNPNEEVKLDPAIVAEMEAKMAAGRPLTANPNETTRSTVPV